MNRAKKLEAVILHLTESHLDSQGGYPYDYDAKTFKDHVIVAGLDPGKENARTELEIHRKDDLVAWFDRAAGYAKEYGGGICEAFNETAPRRPG